MSLSLSTTIWNRMSITRLVLAHYAEVANDLDLVLHAICSSHEDAEKVEEFPNWQTHFYPNEPLNEKHNRAVEVAKNDGTDGVCVVNSDDLITRPYLERATVEMLEGVEMTRFLAYVMINTKTGEAAFAPSAFPASGTVFSARLLEELDWAPWQGDPIDKYLDTRLVENLHEVEPPALAYQSTPSDPVQLCALKSDSNIWTYSEHLDAVEVTSKIDGEDYMKAHFPNTYPYVYDAELQREEQAEPTERS